MKRDVGGNGLSQTCVMEKQRLALTLPLHLRGLQLGSHKLCFVHGTLTYRALHSVIPSNDHE